MAIIKLQSTNSLKHFVYNASPWKISLSLKKFFNFYQINKYIMRMKFCVNEL